jgi:hypothetical protein
VGNLQLQRNLYRLLPQVSSEHSRLPLCPNDLVSSEHLLIILSGFGVAAPNYDSNPIRPFSGALCTSWIGPGELYDITSYDASKYLSIVPATAAATGTVVFADAFDGIMATAAAATTTKV